MSRPVSEPTPTTFHPAWLRYWFATRPAFILATLTACMLGQAGAIQSGVSMDWRLAVSTWCLAAVLHAAVNVLNDYVDAKNGADALNDERVFPFTGGSRFIQNGLLTALQTRNFGMLLLVIAVLGGLVLTCYVGLGLLTIGMVGVLLGWAYSAPPLQLNARGLGECAVLLGFLGLVVGADYVLRGNFSLQPVVVGLSNALLVTSLLYINQFPDRKADAQAHKRTLVVRLPLPTAVKGYALLLLLALVWLVWMVMATKLPPLALVAALPLVGAWLAYAQLKQHAGQPSQLRPAIQLTLASLFGHALLLTFILLWTTP
jgi:1,4-dihydroxy-2-naphthoate polyprenyltransferase